MSVDYKGEISPWLLDEGLRGFRDVFSMTRDNILAEGLKKISKGSDN